MNLISLSPVSPVPSVEDGPFFLMNTNEQYAPSSPTGCHRVASYRVLQPRDPRVSVALLVWSTMKIASFVTPPVFLLGSAHPGPFPLLDMHIRRQAIFHLKTEALSQTDDLEGASLKESYYVGSSAGHLSFPSP